MQTASKSLSSDTEKRQHQVLDLQSKLSDKNEEIVHLKRRYQHMLEQFRLGQQRQFGQSSESSPNQTELFDEAEQILNKPAAKSPEKAVAGHTRQAPKRKPFPADLPR